MAQRLRLISAIAIRGGMSAVGDVTIGAIILAWRQQVAAALSTRLSALRHGMMAVACSSSRCRRHARITITMQYWNRADIHRFARRAVCQQASLLAALRMKARFIPGALWAVWNAQAATKNSETGVVAAKNDASRCIRGAVTVTGGFRFCCAGVKLSASALLPWRAVRLR